MEEKELSSLPESSNEFWENAEVLKKEIIHNKCEHHFVYVGTKVAECDKCHTGYPLSEGWYIENGKIYFNEQLVI